MKVHQLLEEEYPLILDLIKQRMAKGEEVFATFVVNDQSGHPTQVTGRIHDVNGYDVFMWLPGPRQARYVLGPDADEKYRLEKHSKGWMVSINEAKSQRPLLLDLIDQRLAKGERVKLDFWKIGSDRRSSDDHIIGDAENVFDDTVYFRKARWAGTRRISFFQDADERYELVKVDGSWVVRACGAKISESTEEPLLKTLLLQLMAKHEPVKLDFWHEGFTFRGYITLVRGNTIHAMYTKRNGDTETERFVLPPDADDGFTLRKLKGEWVLQKI